ncbi:hypothetical protein AAIR98_000452 [Elusimicrobium simillimum]|uniref:hypothetical protein n=1 Tax=Elusimicrobium simillimum TaxID=3143438 RepID=UPI003C6F29DC
MKKFISVLFIFTLVLGMSACKYLQIGPKGEGEYVLADSMVPYNEVDVNSMKKEGIAAAQKAAVEQVAGVFVSASTTVDHSQVVQSQIVSKSAGFIRKYYVMSSYRKGDQWYTQIKALVLVTDISNIIKQSDESTLIKKTNIMVASKESVNDEISLKQDCKQAIYGAMRNSPYALMNGDNLSQSNIDDPVSIIDKARYDGARYIILADVNAAPITTLGSITTPFKSYRASVNMRLLSTKNYGVIGTSASQQSGLDGVESIAAQKAISAACDMATKDLLEPLKSAVNSARSYNLKIKDVNNIERLKSVQNILRDLREIEDFNLVRYNNSNADFEIQANIKTSDELVAKIIRQFNANFTVDVVTTKDIVLKLI